MYRLHSYDDGISFHHIDKHAKKANQFKFKTLAEFASYLSEGLPQESEDASLTQREILLTRGFLIWYFYARHDWEKLNGLVAITQMFLSFCQCVDIESKVICGRLKCGADDAFQQSYNNGSWVAFKTNNKWHLVNPYWCMVETQGYKSGGVVKLEEDGNIGMAEVDFCPGLSVDRFDDDWFCTNPSMFLNRHFPDDPTCQMLQNNTQPMSFEKWSNIPFLGSHFFKSHLRLLSGDSCRLKSTNGKTTIMLMGEDTLFKHYSFSYELFLRDSDIDTLKLDDLPRLVFPGREGKTFVFEIRFPLKGTYFFHILVQTMHAAKCFSCAQFMIECDEADPNCRKFPVDTGIVGFGYGPAAEDAGLKQPSIKGSKLNLKPKPDDTNNDENQSELQKISFKIDADAIAENEFWSIMYANDKEKTVPTLLNESTRRLEITPPAEQDSEYALGLYQRRKHTKEYFTPALYYLVNNDGDEHDEIQQMAKQRSKEVVHEAKLQEKMEKNSDLKEKIQQMKAAINSLST